MNNLREFLEITYEYSVEEVSHFFFQFVLLFITFFLFLFQYIVVDNQRVVQLQLLNKVGVLVIPLVSSVYKFYIINYR